MGKPKIAAGKPVQAAPGAYVHFSDKMTGALMNINSVIEDNRSTLDSIQDMAVELTRAIRALQAVAMKYVGMADDILETIVPIMEGLPIVPQRVKEFAKDALVLAKKIAAASELAERVLPGVEAGLTTADMTKLQASTGEVANLTRALQAMRD
jgi:methyl-accepting chemotaxis protein